MWLMFLCCSRNIWRSWTSWACRTTWTYGTQRYSHQAWKYWLIMSSVWEYGFVFFVFCKNLACFFLLSGNSPWVTVTLRTVTFDCILLICKNPVWKNIHLNSSTLNRWSGCSRYCRSSRGSWSSRLPRGSWWSWTERCLWVLDIQKDFLCFVNFFLGFSSFLFTGERGPAGPPGAKG